MRVTPAAALVILVATAPAGAAEAPLPPSRPPELGQGGGAAAPSLAPAIEHHDIAADNAACAERLAKFGVRAEPVPPIANGACGTRSPLRLTGLPDGLDVSPPATVTCAVAEALVRWTLEAVTAEAERHLSAAPTKVVIGTSYECRGQNRQAGAKLSEHAFANAVDVMGFEFHKRGPVSITSRSDDGPEARFQAAVRGRACDYFTTVLGPGSDAAHADHLHLDMRERRAGLRLCQ